MLQTKFDFFFTKMSQCFVINTFYQDWVKESDSWFIYDCGPDGWIISDSIFK